MKGCNIFLHVGNFMNWYLHGVYDGETDPKLISVGDTTWFRVSQYVNNQRNTSRSAQSPTLLAESCSHDVELGRGML